MRFYVKRKRTPQIIIVSLIDIFAMLLIFFIVTTTFKTAESELSIKLPESKTATQAENPKDPVVLAITADEKIVLDDHPLNSVDDLVPALQDVQKKAPDRAAGDESGSEGIVRISRAGTRFFKKGRG